MWYVLSGNGKFDETMPDFKVFALDLSTCVLQLLLPRQTHCAPSHAFRSCPSLSFVCICVLIVRWQTRTWSEPFFTGYAPRPRGGHSCVCVRSRLYVFGGMQGAAALGDFYCLDLRMLRQQLVSKCLLELFCVVVLFFVRVSCSCAVDSNNDVEGTAQSRRSVGSRWPCVCHRVSDAVPAVWRHEERRILQ